MPDNFLKRVIALREAEQERAAAGKLVFTLAEQRIRLELAANDITKGEQIVPEFCERGHKLRVDNKSGNCAKCKRGVPATGRTLEDVKKERAPILQRMAEERLADSRARQELQRAEKKEKPRTDFGPQGEAMLTLLEDHSEERRKEMAVRQRHQDVMRRFRAVAEGLEVDPDQLLSEWIEEWLRPLRKATRVRDGWSRVLSEIPQAELGIKVPAGIHQVPATTMELPEHVTVDAEHAGNL